MEVKVELNNLRTAPRKVRQVADLVRGKKVPEAQAILSFTVNKSARNVLKLLNSAIATLKHDLHVEDETNLFVYRITVDEGPKLKRWHPMSRGRAYPILKRTSHIALTLSDVNPKTKIKAEVKKQPEKPVEIKKETKPAKKAVKTIKKTTKKENK